jgi:excisionase family DNA binding protein
VSSEPLLTVEGVAKRLTVSRRGVYYMLERGLPCIRLGKKTLRFDPEAVDRWLAERAASQAASR